MGLVLVILLAVVVLGGLYIACNMVYVFFKHYASAYADMYLARLPRITVSLPSIKLSFN